MKRLVFLLASCVPLTVANAQSSPSPADVERKMQELRATIPALIERAEREAAVSARRVTPTSEQAKLPGKAVLDPAQLAKQFQQIQDPRNPADKALPAMVFVSLSMPSETLKVLARDSALSGVPLLVRGLKYGVGQDNIRRGLEELRPYAELGANILVHPEAFETYGISAVPAFVVDPDAASGCADGQCASRAKRVVGEVTLEYAMGEIGQGRGEAARLAQEAVALLRRRDR